MPSVCRVEVDEMSRTIEQRRLSTEDLLIRTAGTLRDSITRALRLIEEGKHGMLNTLGELGHYSLLFDIKCAELALLSDMGERDD